MSELIKGTQAMTMHVNDMDAARSFYKKGLGLQELQADDQSAAFKVPGSGPLVLHNWQSQCQESGGRPPGTVTGIMLACEDMDAVFEHVQKAGGKVTVEPFPAPTGKGRWSTIADPDGNELMLAES